MKKWRTLVNGSILSFALGLNAFGYADNQTPTVSTVLPEDSLPYHIEIELADFQLPAGFHSGVSAQYKGKWLFLAGRSNGLHGFDNSDFNFPPTSQNTLIFVVDPKNKTVKTRSITDPSSGLTQEQIDQLSATSPQAYQSGKTLYMTGGYGVDTLSGQFTTKNVLTAFDIPGVIHWVWHPKKGDTLAKHVRQFSHPILEVTGGFMTKIGKNPTLLVFGQNFPGFYDVNSNGEYTDQVRRFKIHDDGKNLSIEVKSFKPIQPDQNYRRRDLNVLPTLKKSKGHLEEGLVALSGVFTPSSGAWTVPVCIEADGTPFMPNPDKESTFKQGMSNYVSAACGLFSKKSGNMYNLLFGGITFGFFQNGQFQTDDELPFTNQVTTVKIDKNGKFSQYIMNGEYPVILSTQSNPGNQLLFGAGAEFMLKEGIPRYKNGVLKLDSIKKPTVVGYIVGGIQSTLPNTNVITDSTGSPYIFKVIVKPKK